MKNKKVKLGVCVSLAVAGLTAGAAGIIFSVQSQKQPVNPFLKGDYMVTFDCGNGEFENTNYSKQKVFKGTTLDRVAQPTVKMYSPRGKETFMGWVDETNHFVDGRMAIDRDIKLTAAFTSGAIIGEYHTLTFVQETGWTLKGNTSVAVKDATSFFMVNRPEATASNKSFKGWKYYKAVGSHKKDEIVDENHKITADTWIYPYFESAVTITWDADQKSGGFIKHGSSTTQMPINTTFSEFNQPQVENNDPTKYFTKWYYADDMTEVNPRDVIKSDTRVVAGWGDPTPTTGYSMVTFVVNTSGNQPQDITFTPATTTAFKQRVQAEGQPEGTLRNAKWSDVSRPTVTANSGYWLLDDTKWEISLDKGKTWETDPLTDDYEFSTAINTFYIRPTMKSAITGVTISGATNTLPETSYQYNAAVAGGKLNDVNWSLWQDEACTETPLSEDVAEVDEYGKVTTKFIDSTAEGAVTKFYLKATSKFDDTQSGSIAINVTMPYEWAENGYNKQVWFARNNHWYSFNLSDLCELGTKAYTATALDVNGSPLSVIKIAALGEAKVNDKLIVGRASDLNAIPDQFLAGFSNFIGSIDFGANITSIGSSFLEGCKNYNTEDGFDLSRITSIGSNFLYQCSSFNQPITLKSDCAYVGDQFLSWCTSFNNTITLPTEATAFTIGERFLADCTAFNKNLTIPASTTKVGDFFMTNCVSFTSELNILCEPTTTSKIFQCNQHDISASKVGYFDSEQGGIVIYPIYAKGFTLAGPGAAKFAEFYPTTASGTTYRRIYDSTTWVNPTAEQYAAGLAKIFTAAKPNFTVNSFIANNGSETSSEMLYVETKTDDNNRIVYKSTNSSGDKYTIKDTNLNRYVVTQRGKLWFDSLVDATQTEWSTFYVSTIYNTYINGKTWTYNTETGYCVLDAAADGHAEIKFGANNNIEVIKIVPTSSDKIHGHFVFSDYDTTSIDLQNVGRYITMTKDGTSYVKGRHIYNSDNMSMDTLGTYAFKSALGTTAAPVLADANTLTVTLADKETASETTEWTVAPTFTVQVVDSTTGSLKNTLNNTFTFSLVDGKLLPAVISIPDDLGITGTLADTDYLVIRFNAGANTGIVNVYMNAEISKIA